MATTGKQLLQQIEKHAAAAVQQVSSDDLLLVALRSPVGDSEIIVNDDLCIENLTEHDLFCSTKEA